MAKNPDLNVFQSMDHTIKRIEQTGELLGAQSTVLSEFIKNVEDRLAAVPGKVEAFAKQGDVALSYSRLRTWGLWLLDDECSEEEFGRVPVSLVSTTISRKARAFPVLLELLREIETEQKRQLSEVNSALRLLESEGK